MVTVDQAATRLGVNRKTLYEAFRKSEAPGVAKIGGRFVIDWTAFHAAIAAGGVRIG